MAGFGPIKRPMIGYLTREEMLAVIGEPRPGWTSQRDHLLLRLLYNTGARVSEIIDVKRSDVVLDGVSPGAIGPVQAGNVTALEVQGKT